MTDQTPTPNRKGTRRRRPEVLSSQPELPAGHLPSAPPSRARFRRLDEYRVRREWLRYEGTAQRDLFRELRQRFLIRHAQGVGPALEVGPGPGRFAPSIGSPRSRLALLDLSAEMLQAALRSFSKVAPERGAPDLIRGDAARLPFREATFATVVAFGNVLGFSEGEWRALLEQLSACVVPGGALLLELVPSFGERSRYLKRLPPGAVSRLLRAPIRAVEPRVEREGFAPTPPGPAKPFARVQPAEVAVLLRSAGLTVRETVSVAPCLGGDPERLEAIRPDGVAWSHLMELEEVIGRAPARIEKGSAVLMAAVRG